MTDRARPVHAAQSANILTSPWLLVGLVYIFGIVLRAIYTFYVQPPERFITSDMYFYVQLSKKFLAAHGPADPWDVTHPLGYPALLAFMTSEGGSLARVVILQFILCCLVPPALGFLGAAAYGRRTGMLAVMFGSLYFPFIEYGALFLSEIHFIFWLTAAFALLFAVHKVRRRWVGLALAAGGGVALSAASAFKSVALPAAFLLAVVEGVALLLTAPAPADARTRLDRLRPWVLRWAIVGIAAAPLLGVQARACTHANAGNFCVSGNKMGADLLLGHYGRLGAIEWNPPGGNGGARFGSPGAYLRRYEATARVPFALNDSPANSREAWRWIVNNPGEAIVLSLDHIYDAFLGSGMWPGYGHPTWIWTHLSQYIFIAFLFIPLIPICARIFRRGLRAALTSRTALLLAPVAALTITVAIATGEVRYRVPFDIFLITIVCASVAGDLRRVDG
jgi:hypothetical protein